MPAAPEVAVEAARLPQTLREDEKSLFKQYHLAILAYAGRICKTGQKPKRLPKS
jgi:hypothetical protein